MKPFQEYLNELFDKGKYPWKKKSGMKGYYNYTFDTQDGQSYRVFMALNEYTVDELNLEGTEYEDDDEVEAWEVLFTLKNKNTGMPTTDATGTGNEIRVFSTVLDILKDFKKSAKPKIMFFSAKENSRRKLYDRLVYRFGRGYEISTSTAREGKEYTLYK